MFNIDKIKKDFTILKNNPTLTYLDSAATSLTPDVVIEAMNEYYYHYRATVHRSMYANGQKADEKYQASRETIAKFLNCQINEVIFTKSTTNALNLVANSLVTKLNGDDEILTSALEHHSTLLPFREFAKQKGLNTKYIPINKYGEITYDNFLNTVNAKTKIVVLHHVSNVLGDVVPIKKIAKYCQENNIITVFDGAQAITHEQIDVKEIGCDFYAFSGHKILGPTGIGVLYANNKIAKDLIFEYGGDMAHIVTIDDVTTKELPLKLEAGTPSIAEVIGIKAAIDYLMQYEFDDIARHIYELKIATINLMKEIPGIIIYNENTKNGIITFNFENIPTHDVLQELANENIAIRGGHMCNQLTLKYLGVNSVLRISFYIYNDLNDVKKLINGLKKAASQLAWML